MHRDKLSLRREMYSRVAIPSREIEKNSSYREFELSGAGRK